MGMLAQAASKGDELALRAATRGIPTMECHGMACQEWVPCDALFALPPARTTHHGRHIAAYVIALESASST